MEVHRAARKHGVADADMLLAAEQAVYFADPTEDPHRQLRLGFSITGVLLEIVVLIADDGQELVIHAMKARRQYEALLNEQGW